MLNKQCSTALFNLRHLSMLVSIAPVLVLRNFEYQSDITQVYRTVHYDRIVFQIYNWYFGPYWAFLLGNMNHSGKCFDTTIPFTD